MQTHLLSEALEELNVVTVAEVYADTSPLQVRLDAVTSQVETYVDDLVNDMNQNVQASLTTFDALNAEDIEELIAEKNAILDGIASQL